MTTKTNTKIGDVLYHITGYKVKVIGYIDADFPIKVETVSKEIMFISLDVNLFGMFVWFVKKPKPITNNIAYYLPRADIDIDTLIHVYNYNTKEWIMRYFAGWDDNNKPLIWRSGTSSFTTSHDPIKITGSWATSENFEKVKNKQKGRIKS